MERRHIVAIGLIAVASVVLVGLAFTGTGPFPTDESNDLDDGVPTESTPSPGETPTEPAFSFEVDRVDDCGETCRDVTATLYNLQQEPATDVTVHTRIYAGENNTEDDDLVWSGESEVGTIEAEGSYTETERIELSLVDAFKIQQRDYWITIVTVVDSDEATVSFRETQQVD